jgi:large subunit ribosomal protein L7/L12
MSEIQEVLAAFKEAAMQFTKATEALEKLVMAQVTEVDSCGVILLETGQNKINVIKVIREFTNWGLRESKEAAEHTPYTITPLNKETAKKMVKQLNSVGAKAKAVFGDCDTCSVRFQCYTSR